MVAKKMWTALVVASSLLGAGCGKSPKEMCKIRRDVWTRCGTKVEGMAAGAVSDATCAAEVEHAQDHKLASRFEKAAVCAEDKECGAIVESCDHMILPPSAVAKEALGKVSEELKKGPLDFGKAFGEDAYK